MGSKGVPLWEGDPRESPSFLFYLVFACLVTVVASGRDPRLEDKGPPPPNLPFEPLTSPPECLACDDIFSFLEETDSGLVQRVEVAERGAPKSGTGGMFENAINSLYHTCRYLNQHYGRDTCFVDWGRWGPGDYYGNHTLIFEPPLEQPSDAPCPCTGVRRVTISLSKIGKHALPVEDTCPYAHGVGYHLHLQFCEADEKGGGEGSRRTSTAAMATPAANFDKIWRCMQEARCRVTDDRKQMVIFRDPRAAAVSSFYFLRAGKYISGDLEVDAFVLQNFPIFCKWLVIRLALFSRMFEPEKVSYFWYDRWQADPLEWHRRLLRVVGLRVPDSVAVAAFESARADDFPFFAKGRDSHGDGADSVPPIGHTYRDDITEETARSIDETMRQWLPSSFIERLLTAA